MIPGINPKQMQAVMKQMGISQKEIEAEKVIIEKLDGGRIIITDPQVTKIKMSGQESFQITGEINEEDGKIFSEEDIKMVIEKTGCTAEKAKASLEETGDLAQTILNLS